MPCNYIFDSIRLLSASVTNVVGVQIGLWLAGKFYDSSVRSFRRRPTAKLHWP